MNSVDLDLYAMVAIFKMRLVDSLNNGVNKEDIERICRQSHILGEDDGWLDGKQFLDLYLYTKERIRPSKADTSSHKPA